MSGTAVVTLAHGRHDHLERQRRSRLTDTVRPDLHVVVAMGDDEVGVALDPVLRTDLQVVPLAADPSALPLAAARNLGARTALEQGADTLVFLDVDCLAGPDLVPSYAAAAAAESRTLWSGPVTYLGPGDADAALARPLAHDDPHPARPAPAPGEVVRDADPRLFWSLSFAVHREGWESAGGFCEDYVGYGGEDTDFAASAAGRGLALAWLGAARAYHQHHPVQSPPVHHLDAILRNARVFHDRWGTWPMVGWLEAFEELGLVHRGRTGWQRV